MLEAVRSGGVWLSDVPTGCGLVCDVRLSRTTGRWHSISRV